MPALSRFSRNSGDFPSLNGDIASNADDVFQFPSIDLKSKKFAVFRFNIPHTRFKVSEIRFRI